VPYRRVYNICFFRLGVIVQQGDRVGICVTQFDAKLMERGLAATPGSVPTISTGIALLRKIKYFRSPVKQKTKFHGNFGLTEFPANWVVVTVGHTTVMATPIFFALESQPSEATPGEGTSGSETTPEFDFSTQYIYREELVAPKDFKGPQWALLQFEKPITCPMHSLLIGSRLDTDIRA
jgi:selenocysteine-specific elongation factor